MGTTDERRAVLNAAESGRINITFEAGMNVPKSLYGEMVSGASGAPNEAMVLFASHMTRPPIGAAIRATHRLFPPTRLNNPSGA
jgi:hypothetical protein